MLSEEADMGSHFAILTQEYGMPYEFDREGIQNMKPGEDEALVRLDFTGVCHGDVYSRDGGGPASAQPIRPLIGGHEGVGEIVALGVVPENVHRKFAIGDKVGVAWRSGTCGKCQACSVGAENHCQLQEVVGMHRDGTFQRLPLSTLSGIDRTQLIPDLRVHYFPNRRADSAAPKYRSCLSMPNSLRWCHILRRHSKDETAEVQVVRNQWCCRRRWTSSYSVREKRVRSQNSRYRRRVSEETRILQGDGLR